MVNTLKVILAAAVAIGSTAQGTIIYSGVQNLAIPVNFGGIYLDFQNANDATLTGVQTGATALAVPNWDFNLFFGGAAIGNSTTALPVTSATTTNSPIQNLAVGTIVDGTDTYPTGFSGSTGHMTGAGGQFTSGTEGWIGFSIPQNTMTGQLNNTVLYGAMRVTLHGDGSAGTLHDWFWDNSGAAIAIPEPSTIIPLAALLTPWVLRRRRRRS